MPQQLIDTLILSMGRRCETCLAVREIISLLKNGCFLLDTHHRDVSAFSRIALHATFSIKLLFIPLISLLLLKLCNVEDVIVEDKIFDLGVVVSRTRVKVSVNAENIEHEDRESALLDENTATELGADYWDPKQRSEFNPDVFATYYGVPLRIHFSGQLTEFSLGAKLEGTQDTLLHL
ncbi:hypothetical protein TNCV_3197391 [Trichonephila clavipes]|nr:hypothetical protein TNCV_3197391 [Trichonephila clavipes]